MGVLHLFPKGTLTYDSKGITSNEIFSKGRYNYDEIIDISFMKANWVTNGHIKIKTKNKPFVLFNFSIKRNDEAKTVYSEITQLRNKVLFGNYYQRNNSYSNNNINNSQNSYNQNNYQDSSSLNNDSYEKFKKIKEERINLEKEHKLKLERERELKLEKQKLKDEQEKNRMAEEKLKQMKLEKDKLNKKHLQDEVVKDINTLNYQNLKRTPGIDTVLAHQILDNRKKGKLIYSLNQFIEDYSLNSETIDLITADVKLGYLEFEEDKKQEEIKKQEKISQELNKLNEIRLQREKLEEQQEKEKQRKLMEIKEEKAKLEMEIQEEESRQYAIRIMEERKIEDEKRKIEEQKRKELEKLAPIDLNTANIDILKKIPYLDLDMIETIMDLRSYGLYIKSFDDLKGKLNLTNPQINDLKNYLIINSLESEYVITEKIEFNDADLIDLINVGINEITVAKIILDRKEDKLINSFDELKDTYGLADNDIKKIKKYMFIAPNIKTRDILTEKIEKSFNNIHKDNDKLNITSKIDINAAKEEELIKLPNMTIERIQELLELRDNNEFIFSYDDLKDKLNLSDEEINQIKKLILISKPNIINDGRVVDL